MNSNRNEPIKTLKIDDIGSQQVKCEYCGELIKYEVFGYHSYYCRKAKQQMPKGPELLGPRPS